mgnify:CR=1 FL=1
MVKRVASNGRSAKLTLVFETEPPFSYTLRDLKKPFRREEVIEEMITTASVWSKAIIGLWGPNKPRTHHNT